MSYFDNPTPIVNPRRFLKQISHKDSIRALISDDEISAIITKDNYNNKVPVSDEIPAYARSISVQNNTVHGIGIKTFLRRFFTELRRIDREMVVQPMDDDQHATFGIFVRTKTAKEWSEYRSLDHDTTYYADVIIQCWKRLEDEMRAAVVSKVQTDHSIKFAGVYIRFRKALEECQSAVEAATRSKTACESRDAQATATLAFDNLSRTWMDIVDKTDVLETAITVFFMNVQSYCDANNIELSVFAAAGLPARVPSFMADRIHAIARPDVIPVLGIHGIPLDEAFLDDDVQTFISMNRAVLRAWFRGLQLTPPSMLR